MSRPRTPTELLELRGSFKRNPQRRRDVGPKSTRDLGAPYPHLTKAEKTAWLELADMAPAGVLTYADRWAVETAAKLKAKERVGLSLTAAERANLISLYGKFAITPADRSKVAVKPEAESSPLDEFTVN